MTRKAIGKFFSDMGSFLENSIIIRESRSYTRFPGIEVG